MTVEPRVQRLEEKAGELLEQHSSRASREELARWADDPVGWDLEAGREPTDYQRTVMRSVAENKRTAWRGCHACGKEWVLGSLAVHGAYARGMLVLVVSATEPQVLGQTMPEVRKAWRAARKAHGIGGELYQGSVRIGGEDRIVARTGSANVDALTGWHDASNGVLVLISEGQGERLEQAAYDAAEGNVTTSKGRILAAGNPVRPSGRFYEIHNRATWNRFQTSAFDTPNVKAGEQVRDGFPAPDWPEDVAREYGEDSSFYQGRVEAQFPETAEDALIDRDWIERAMSEERWSELREEGRHSRIVVGVDPARLGPDRTVMAVRQGPVVRGFESWQGADTQESAERVRDEVVRLIEQRGGVKSVVVDEVGVGGGVLDRLRELLPEVTYYHQTGGYRPKLRERSPRAVGFTAGSTAPNSDRFRDVKAHSYWRLRSELEEGRLALPGDEGLREELLQTRVEFTAEGKTKIETKDRIKSRIGRSPDLADALSMTFAEDLKSNDTQDFMFT